MGRIFGISDLPVSTIMTPFEPVRVVQEQKGINTKRNYKDAIDVLVSQKKCTKENTFTQNGKRIIVMAKQAFKRLNK